MAASEYAMGSQPLMPDQSGNDGADGAHTHPSYDQRLSDIEQRLSALEGDESTEGPDDSQPDVAAPAPKPKFSSLTLPKKPKANAFFGG